MVRKHEIDLRPARASSIFHSTQFGELNNFCMCTNTGVCVYVTPLPKYADFSEMALPI